MYALRSRFEDNRPVISRYAVERLGQQLWKIKELNAAYLYPVFDGWQYVFVGIVSDNTLPDLFNRAAQYSEKRAPFTKGFTSEQLRVHELLSMVEALPGWLQSLNLEDKAPSLLHDALLLPSDWKRNCLELQHLYHSTTMGFISLLVDREPIVIFRR